MDFLGSRRRPMVLSDDPGLVALIADQKRSPRRGGLLVAAAGSMQEATASVHYRIPISLRICVSRHQVHTGMQIGLPFARAPILNSPSKHPCVMSRKVEGGSIVLTIFDKSSPVRPKASP